MNITDQIKKTNRIDKRMAFLIKFGGMMVIIFVLAILFFILSQIIPLFKKTKLESYVNLDISQTNHNQNILFAGSDERGKLPFVAYDNGDFIFYACLSNADQTNKGNYSKSHNIYQLLKSDSYANLFKDEILDKIVHCQIKDYSFNGENNTFILFLKDHNHSYLILGKVYYQEHYMSKGISLKENIKLLDIISSKELSDYYSDMEIEYIHHLKINGDKHNSTIALTVQANGNESHLYYLLLFNNQFNLQTKFSKYKALVLLSKFENFKKEVMKNTYLLLSKDFKHFLVANKNGNIDYYFLDNNKSIKLKQNFNVFPNKSLQIKNINFIFGDVSFYILDNEGNQYIYSLYLQDSNKKSSLTKERLWGQIKFNLPTLKSSNLNDINRIFFSKNYIDKVFLIAFENQFELIYPTTESSLLKKKLEYPIKQIFFSQDGHKIFIINNQFHLLVYQLKNDHPEVNFKTFFTKIWYEGYDKPLFIWQSSASNDDNEPKLSLIPLMFGSLKGTFYALIFSIPLALLAAIYTSQFLSPNMRNYIKPMMEFMASIPSVVLGFLGALYLAPLLEDKIPSVIAIIIIIPLVTIFLWYVVNQILYRFNQKKSLFYGKEYYFTIGIVIVLVWIIFASNHQIEALFFTTTLENGDSVSSFKVWLKNNFNSSFQQRNSLIIGIVMGFTVLPIIFTISEDAISSVPSKLKFGALALGATRWKTVWKVILPVAKSGIFSAIMIGFGRAVGETMILVMVTGNTPIMDFNIFNGMRTLSANIAVEMPEAPAGGTLYRTLYLGAFILFILTFVINTLAEIFKKRIRNNYKAID